MISLFQPTKSPHGDNNRQYEGTKIEMTKFHRGEIKVGQLIQQGRFFCENEIVRFHLHANNDDGGCVPFSPVEKEMRKFYEKNFDRGTFKIKEIKKNLDKEALKDAETRLQAEAQYLAKLNDHPSFVTVRGRSLNETSATSTQEQGLLENSSYSYGSSFLILDHMQDTLEMRIDEWRRGHHETDEPDEELIPIKTNYAYQIASALRWLQVQGIEFPPLKLQNIGFKKDRHTIQIDIDSAVELMVGSSTSFQSLMRSSHMEALHSIIRAPQDWASIYYAMLAEIVPPRENVDFDGSLSSKFDLVPEDIRELLLEGLDGEITIGSICKSLTSILFSLDEHLLDVREEYGEFLFELQLEDDDTISAISSCDNEEDSLAESCASSHECWKQHEGPCQVRHSLSEQVAFMPKAA